SRNTRTSVTGGIASRGRFTEIYLGGL
ncbi:MAG: hypothetical protein QOG57_4822, partial [Pseudonocardiales bacterium]|nr:hypothetical protein [Pseudonocardiales bacterium]